MQTLAVPITGTETPATLFTADKVPMRVVIRNTGGVPVYLAHDSASLVTDGTSGILNTFQLPAGVDTVIVLAPKQGVYAVGFGAGAEVSIAVSEAIPMKWGES